MGQGPASADCEVAIIGTGPYGLSLAAHLAAKGVEFRIFGKPMALWREHMPKSMMLKSNGYASNLSAPDGKASTLKSYCRQAGKPYGDLNFPIPLDTFIAYADWFRARHVPVLEEQMVTELDRDADGFVLTLENGRTIRAAQVVMAVGVTGFAHMPAALKPLPPSLASHSFDHRTVDHFAGRDVVVVGAGASAINLLYELKLAGSRPRLLVRAPAVEYHQPPDPNAQSLWERLRSPPAPFGHGWRSLLVARLPQIFYRLPGHLRARAIRSHLHPSAAWFMRDKVQHQVPVTLDRAIAAARPEKDKVRLILSGGEEIVCDHVIAATGYRMDLGRLGFLSDRIRHAIQRTGRTLEVTPAFETDLPGLYALGPLAMENFGPLLRFVCGTSFAAPRLARVLRRRVLLARAQAWIVRAGRALLGRPGLRNTA